MLSTVSQFNLNTNYKKFYKNFTFKENPAINRENTDIFLKEPNNFSENKQKLSDQQKNFLMHYIASTILISSLIGVFVYFLKNKGKLSSSEFSNIEDYKFESLKNNANIPTLDNCKGINKNLKLILQHQLKLAGADKEILKEAGTPETTNRFLLSGPPGVGKTYFSKVYAKTLNAEYLEVLFSDLNSRWVGEVEEKMGSVFKKIIQQAEKNPDKKYVVTFNEIDSMLLPVEHLTGGSGSTHFATLRRERSTFLTYIDKLQNEVPNVTVIGTTNLSPQNKNLDGAAMSRFQNVTEISYPDSDCLYEAMKLALEEIKGSGKFITENDEKLKELTKTMADRKSSFRNLEYIINEAKSRFLDKKIDDRNADFKFKYLENAQKNLQRTDGEREFSNNTKNIKLD